MIVVTGASGQFGRLVVEGLLATSQPSEIVAATRHPDALADLAERGVLVRHADFDAPETLATAFAGADKVLLVSASVPGIRVAQHKSAIEAAVSAGAGFIAYTSALHTDDSPLIVAPDHKTTEDTVVSTGLPHTFLRNGWYTENYQQTINNAAKTGVFLGCAGDGRVASAARADYAAAAVAVLTAAAPDDVYELSGDAAWSYPELAAEVSRVSGREVGYRNLSFEDHRAALIEAGLPEPVAEVYASFDRDTALGALAYTPGQLSALIGRPTTPLAESVEAFLYVSSSS